MKCSFCLDNCSQDFAEFLFQLGRASVDRFSDGLNLGFGGVLMQRLHRFDGLLAIRMVDPVDRFLCLFCRVCSRRSRMSLLGSDRAWRDRRGTGWGALSHELLIRVIS